MRPFPHLEVDVPSNDSLNGDGATPVRVPSARQAGCRITGSPQRRIGKLCRETQCRRASTTPHRRCRSPGCTGVGERHRIRRPDPGDHGATLYAPPPAWAHHHWRPARVWGCGVSEAAVENMRERDRRGVRILPGGDYAVAGNPIGNARPRPRTLRKRHSASRRCTPHRHPVRRVIMMMGRMHSCNVQIATGRPAPGCGAARSPATPLRATPRRGLRS